MNFKINILLLWSVACLYIVINAVPMDYGGTQDGGTQDANQSPPYDIIFDRFEVYNNTEKMFSSINLRVKKYNRTMYVLHGDFETVRDFNDDFTAILRASSLSGNEFKMIHTQTAEKFCSSLIENEAIYPEVVEASNLPKITKDMCPIPKNKYTITNYYVKDSKLPQQLPSGDKWKVDILVLEKEEVSVAVSIYVVVERKNKYSSG